MIGILCEGFNAYLKSGVSNQDVPQDHIFSLLSTNTQSRIRLIILLVGGNISTESILPDIWLGPAMDAISLKEILKNLEKVH